MELEKLEERNLLSLLPPVPYRTDQYPVSVLVGDVNGDRVPDLVVINGFPSNSLGVLLGKGDGTFGPEISFPVDNIDSGAVGDFNGDGKLDLALTTQPPYPAFGTVRIYLGNGDGTFQFSSEYAVGSRPFSDPVSVAVGDLRHNGRLDIIVSNAGDSTVSVLLGNGDGTFQDAVNYDLGRSGPQSVAVGDFNGDGYPDLAVAIPGHSRDDPGGVMVLLNNGDGTFQNSGYYVFGSALSVVAADFRGIGRLDLIVSTQGGYGLQELKGNGDGTFDITWRYGGDGFLAVTDFNGDGIPDFVVTNRYVNTVTVYLGHGDGTFLPLNFAAGLTPASVAVGDFNGDGFPDVAVVNFDARADTVSVLLNDTDWPFGPGSPIPPPKTGLSARDVVGAEAVPPAQPVVPTTTPVLVPARGVMDRVKREEPHRSVGSLTGEGRPSSLTKAARRPLNKPEQARLDTVFAQGIAPWS